MIYQSRLLLGVAFATLGALNACSSDAPNVDSPPPQQGVPSGNAPAPGANSAAPSGNGDSNDDTGNQHPPAADGDAGPSTPATPANNGFPAHWIDGTACNSDPKVQTWKFDDRTYIFRQSLCTNFEGPFVYLLIGDQKALLIDNGTGDADLATPVSAALTAAGSSVPLIIAHSHAHSDHVGSDSQFKARANTTLVGTSPSAVYKFWNIAVGKDGTFDLGNRMLDVMAIPGHEASHIAVYDHRTQVILTGDTLYPGRLYIDDWNAYQTSVKHLSDFVASHTVSFVLGGHIELPATGKDYPMGSTVHPSEHVLQLAASDVADLNTTVQSMGNSPVKTYRTNFVVWP